MTVSPNLTLVLIIGTSKCPEAPNLKELPQCRNSAQQFEHYVRETLKVPQANILPLFGSAQAGSEQLQQIEQWLDINTRQKRPEFAATDFVIYYSGHGGFSGGDRAYFLAIQKTREGSEPASSIRFSDLAHVLRTKAGRLRVYIVVDACFAAASVPELFQAAPGQAAMEKMRKDLPPRGIAVLCSSSSDTASLAIGGEELTMFSGALLQVLRQGDETNPNAFLTLAELAQLVESHLVESRIGSLVRPEIHVPQRSKGDIASTVGLFPNAAQLEKDSPTEHVLPRWQTPFARFARRHFEGIFLLLLMFTTVAASAVLLGLVFGLRELSPEKIPDAFLMFAFGNILGGVIFFILAVLYFLLTALAQLLGLIDLGQWWSGRAVKRVEFVLYASWIFVVPAFVTAVPALSLSMSWRLASSLAKRIV